MKQLALNTVISYKTTANTGVAHELLYLRGVGGKKADS
jgi:hypothetical protein